MNKYFVKIIVIALFALSNNSVFSGWDNDGVVAKIVAITILQNGAFYVHADKDICDIGVVNKVGYVYKGKTPNGIAQTTEGINMMLSIALSAHATETPVKLFADDSGSDYGCHLGAIKIY